MNQLFPKQHLLSAWQEVLFLAGWIFLISLPAFLYAYLLFCFPLTIPTNSSHYGCPLRSPLTFSHPVPLPYTPSPFTLTPSASFSCPTADSACRSHVPGTSSPHMVTLYKYPLVLGAQNGHSRPLGFAGGWGVEGWFPSPHGDTDIARQRAVFLISQNARACCGKITGSGGFWRFSISVF